MINNNTILTEVQGSIAHIWLNRPAVHNALNKTMINEFLMTIRSLNDDPAVRIIIISGKGPSFCAGADMNWMQQATDLTPEENLNECNSLARCFYEVFLSRKITITLIHGAAIGGALGLISASDIAFADNSAEFALSEVRFGLVPATIAPYVIRKTGYAKARELMLTGRKFNASEAKHIGLINKVLSEEALESFTRKVIDDILHSAPLAQEAIKTYLNSLEAFKIEKTLIDLSAKLIAETRIAPEAIEGINAFHEKRRPQWYQD